MSPETAPVTEPVTTLCNPIDSSKQQWQLVGTVPSSDIIITALTPCRIEASKTS